MRGLLGAMVFVFGLLSFTNQVAAVTAFDQCVASAQHAVDFCEANIKNDPSYLSYQVEPVHVVGVPILDTNGLYYMYLQGGCNWSGGSNLFLCDTYSPGSVKTPIVRPFGPPARECGSKIQVDEMSVAEEVPLAGTPFNLVYTSERTLANAKVYETTFGFYTSKKLASKDSWLPLTIDFRFTYANGRNGVASLTPDQTAVFLWDGKDASGNYLEAPTKFSFLMKFEHSSYVFSSDYTQAKSIGTWNVQVMGLGGWNIDIHHLYDLVAERLYLGDGSTEPAKANFNGTTYEVVSPDGSEIYYFNSNGRHLTTNDALTNAVKYTFNYLSNGFLSSVVDSYGRTTSILRDGSGNLTGIQGPYGHVTQLTIGSDGYLASITNPKNETYLMTYYGYSGALHTIQKPKGQVSTMTYGALGLTSDTNSAGNYIQMSKGSNLGDPITVLDALGLKRTVYVSGGFAGSSRSETHRSGASSSFGYSPQSQISYSEPSLFQSDTFMGDNPRFAATHKIPTSHSTTFPSLSLISSSTYTQTVTNTSNSPTPFNFDSIAYQSTTNNKTANATYTRATGITNINSPVGRTSSYTTNSLGRATQAKFANFTPTNFAYDTDGRLQYITQGSRQTEIIYNASGDISGVKNPLNQTTSFTYDLAGNVQSVILPDLRTISYTYDANGNVASITPAGSSAHAFTFNPFDLPEYYTPPTVPTSTPATQYIYDNAKRITQITKPDSSTVVFNYHPTTQLLTSIVSSGDTTTMTMDPYSHQPQSTTSQDGIATTQTFASSLFVSSATTNASSVNIGSVAYTYNNDFLPTNLTISAASGSSSVNYTYDNDNIMKTAGSLVISLDGTTGIPTKTTLNKIQEIMSYDSSYGEPLSMLAKYVNGSTTTPLFSQSYVRDALGRISTKTETVGTTTNQFVYTYDTSGRLTNVTKNAAAYSNYTLSDNNNATSGNVGGTAFTATYDAQDRILTYNTNTYTHTLNGEMKSKTVSGVTTNFTYDGFGMLKTAKVGTGPVLTYLYDGLNRRIGKKSGTTVQKYWVYQDQLRIGGELSSAGAITKKFIYGTKLNVPDYMIIGSTTYKIVSDHLGSVRLVVNAATGVISQQIEYNERGEVLSDTSPGFQPFGFAGGLYDTDLKLVHFGARTYDPSIGRWLSKEPLGFSGAMNFYTYVNGDPINFIDPSGLSPEELAAAMTWIRINHPELLANLGNVKAFDVGIPTILPDSPVGLALPFNTVLVDTDSAGGNNEGDLRQAAIVSTLAHELMHLQDGIWNTIRGKGRGHPKIEKSELKIGVDYLNSVRKKKGQTCP